MSRPLVKVEEGVEGDTDGEEVQSGQVHVGAVQTKMTFVIHPSQFCDSYSPTDYGLRGDRVEGK